MSGFFFVILLFFYNLAPHAERGRTNCVSFNICTTVPASVENGFLLPLSREAPAKKNGRISSVHACALKEEGEEWEERVVCLSQCGSLWVCIMCVSRCLRPPCFFLHSCHLWHGLVFLAQPWQCQRPQRHSVVADMLCCCHGRQTHTHTYTLTYTIWGLNYII